MHRKKSVFWVTVHTFFVVTLAIARGATIEGNAAGVDGRPIQNAQIRIQQEEAKRAAVTVKTDSQGHFLAAGLPAGSYRAELLVSGKVVSTVERVKTTGDKTVRLNLGGKQAGVAPAPVSAQAKRSAFVHPPTGSRIGGGRVASDAEKGIETMSRRELERLQSRHSMPTDR